MKLFKKFRQHVAVEWQDIICPEPSMEQWDACYTDTVRNAGKRKLKNEKIKEIEIGIGQESQTGVKKFKKL